VLRINAGKSSKPDKIKWNREFEVVMAIKKGDMVRVVKDKLENSVEATASDSRFPSYIFETKGEVIDMKGDYAWLKFGIVPTPNIWLKLEQLESF
jgi:hypothetical protein